MQAVGNRHLGVSYLVQYAVFIACLLLTNLITYSGNYPDQNLDILIGRGMDSAFLTIGAVMFVSLALNRSATRNDEIFMMLLTLNAAVITTDAASWYVNGDKDLIMWNGWLRTAKNLGLAAESILFWDFMSRYVRMDRNRRRMQLAIMTVVLLMASALIVADIFTDCMFYIDEAGYYRRGSFMMDFYKVMLIPPILTTYYVIRYQSGGREKFASIASLVLVGGLLVLQFFNVGISLMYVAFVIVLIITYANFYVTENERLVRRESMIKKERYDAMMTQLQPHFLYNSLTSIMNIEGMPSEGRDAICDFAAYLRQNIESVERSHPVPFSREIEHVELYLELEKRRFKDNLDYVLDIRDRSFPIPPLTLQMMTENAVRHGITMRPEGGKITITSFETKNGHIVTVTDDGVGFDTDILQNLEHTHRGIDMCRKRLMSEVGGSLTVTSEVGVGTKIEIFIPFRNNE